ncbi:MAG: hypothetical protein KAU03_06900, partial [Candidatus Altiarchaeales archaeon]|nr:hypothetical protein [Candidatus Altiarchaeales archaeon]
RRKANLQEYRPTNDEMERYVEEIKIYNSRVSRLQYLPSDDDIRAIVKNANVCVDGEPTEKREVSIHRDLKGVETNRIRGGACLVIAEGMAQKAPKIMKHATAMGLDWSWLGTVGKGKAEAKEEDVSGDVKPLSGFMSEVVGGRPIFASPSAKGAFRLRYGRDRASGIAAKSIHPATMLLLDEFIATGTQVKVERPGKGCIITNCDSIEGPIIRLRNGSVIRVDDVETARKVKNELDEVLFLGDILVSYGDFLQTNTRLLPAGYCEEWWALEVREISGDIPLETPDVEDAMRIAKEFDAPLHPRYTYHWEDVGISDVEGMVRWLSTGAVDKKLNALVVRNNEDGGKKTLENLGVPHEVDEGDVIIREYLPLLYPLKAHDGVRFTREDFTSSIAEFKGKHEVTSETAFSYVADFSPVKIRRKSGTYIGARMGRPEKARERKMKPAVHSLFPIGGCGGKERLINVAAERNSVEVDVAIYECPECKTVSMYP